MSKQVNIDFIQGFAGATVETFEQMASMKAEPQKPYAKRIGSSIWGVSGVMGITGDVMGVVVLTLPEEASLKAIGALVGEQYSSINAEIIDGVKEFINIIVGNAKAKLDARGYQFNFSLPKVVVGHNYITDHGENTNVIVIPFSSPIGEFILDISVKANNGK